MRKYARILSAALACLFPISFATAQQAREICQYVEIAKAPIRYTGLDLSPSMQASINGKPATMLVDTGAFSSFLTVEGAKRHGLTMWPSFAEVEGVSGTSGILLANIERLSFGPASSTKALMPVLADIARTPSWDGLVGAYFLFQTDLEINLAEKELKFFRGDNCYSAHLGYWDKQAVVVPMGFWSGKHKTPYFTIEINGKEFKAIIDSGAGESSLTLGAAKKLGIKMNGPGVRDGGQTSGIGKAHVKRWIARFERIKIGDETITDTDLAVFEPQGDISADVLLGEDFLRSHRVLFAVSQKKIYLSYVGGNAFRRHDTLEPWLLREAEQGNADAQYHLAMRHFTGTGGAPKNEETALSWLTRAAAQGHPQASLGLGLDLLSKRRYADSVPHLRAALDNWTDDTEIALALHVARLGSGQAELAQQELAPFAATDNDWLQAVVEHYLGKSDAQGLLAKAALDKEDGARRVCVARHYASQRLEALGDGAGAAALGDPACRKAEPVPASAL